MAERDPLKKHLKVKCIAILQGYRKSGALLPKYSLASASPLTDKSAYLKRHLNCGERR